MTNAKAIKAQHLKKTRATCQTVEGKLNPFEK
jgi:hypothetical protein